MAPDADGGVARLQHSRAVAPYEGRLGYVPAACRLEVYQGADKAVQVYETARLYRERAVHKKLCDS